MSVDKLIITAALFIMVFASHAQETGKKNALKINPLSLAFLTGNLAYERAVSHNTSIQLGMYYCGVHLGGLHYSGFGITPEYRFYFAGGKKVFDGLYTAPFLRFQFINIEDQRAQAKASFTSTGGGAIIGYEKMWDGGFTLDIFAGPAYNQIKYRNNSSGNTFDINGGFSGFTIRTGITLGFGF